MSLFHTDANSSVYFQNQLQVILANTYDIRYPEFKYSSLLPVAVEGADLMNVTWHSYDQVGFAKIISADSKDIPRVDVHGVEQSAKIRELATSYGYTLREIRVAQKMGMNLDGRKAAAAKRAIEIEINRIAFLGDEKHGLVGFLNAPNVPVLGVRNGASGDSDWNTKTADEILADMNELVNSIADISHGMEEPNTLLLPRDKLTLIRTMPRGSKSDISVLDYFKGIQPSITTIDWLPHLKGIGPGGADMMVAYDRDPNKLVLRIPKPFEQLPEERSQLEYEVICLAQCGGVNFFYPLSCARGVGI